jgi:hypothetical protein
MRTPLSANGIFLILMASFGALASCADSEDGHVDASFIHIPGEGEERDTPEVTWESDSVDLGLLAAGEKVDIPYLLTNTGRAPLLISQVKPSCGCTASRGWEDRTLSPGASLTLTLSFDAGDRVGTVEEQAMVVTNAVPSASVLKFTAQVLGPDTDMQP